jgi:hypothetical protein
MNGRHFGQIVFEDDADSIALFRFYGRARHAAVIAPRVHRSSREKLGSHDFGD